MCVYRVTLKHWFSKMTPTVSLKISVGVLLISKKLGYQGHFSSLLLFCLNRGTPEAVSEGRPRGFQVTSGAGGCVDVKFKVFSGATPKINL